MSLGNRPTVDVIIPTFNNFDYLIPTLRSLLFCRTAWPLRVIVVNNGSPDSVGPIPEHEIEVIQAGKNLGWEGGLKAGLERSTSEFVVFSNDDIFIPHQSLHWTRNLMSTFKHPEVAAVGPSSNVVMGHQNIFAALPVSSYCVPYLIGFFVMVRRAYLDEVGGIDDTLPGGDDLDLSIRFRKAGYTLVARLDTFIYHHGFKTGERVHGGPDAPNGWNSAKMQEDTDNALIRKHGFKAWMGLYTEPFSGGRDIRADIEGEAVASWVTGDTVLEVGCGDKKTVPNSIGVDRFSEGLETFHRQTSAAQIVADVFKPMPMFDDEHADTIIARHVLEHAMDPVVALQEWRRILKPGGRLIVAAPNEDLGPGIPMDVEHVHAWTPDSFRSLAELCGFKQIAYTPNCGNAVSFVTVLERA